MAIFDDDNDDDDERMVSSLCVSALLILCTNRVVNCHLPTTLTTGP
jgi:hypothetical protein